MSSVRAAWAEKEREYVTKTTNKTGILAPGRLDSSAAHEVAECSGRTVSIGAHNEEGSTWDSGQGFIKEGTGVHIEAIIMVDRSEWHSPSGYGETGMSRWAAVRCGAHVGPTWAGSITGRRSGASSRWAEGATSKHVDSLLKPLEDLLLAAGFDWARVAGVPAGGILLSVGAAPCPL